MNREEIELVNKLAEFSVASMNLCVEETTEATVSVMDILTFMISDANRISDTSADTLKAVQAFRDEFFIGTSSGDESSEGYSEFDEFTARLIAELGKLTNKHKNVDQMAQPIIQVLQFQDRISQNMEHIAHLLNVWWHRRQALDGVDELSADAENEFAFELLAETKMANERAIVYKHFACLQEAESQVEEAEDDVMLF